MKPEDLKGEARSLYESFRSMGVSEADALNATAGRSAELYELNSARTFGRITHTEALHRREAILQRPVPSATTGLAEADYDRRSARVFGRPSRG